MLQELRNFFYLCNLFYIMSFAVYHMEKQNLLRVNKSRVIIMLQEIPVFIHSKTFSSRTSGKRIEKSLL